MYRENVLRPLMRDIEASFRQLPNRLVGDNFFGCPFLSEHRQDQVGCIFPIKSDAAFLWAKTLEKLLFAQLRLPLTKAGSRDNLELYESLSRIMNWTETEEQNLLLFAVQLPLLGGIDAIDPARKHKILSSTQTNSENNFAIQYLIQQVEYGMILLGERGIRLFFGTDLVPSSIIPFHSVNNKETASQYLFPDYDSNTIRFTDLSMEGGATYAQASDTVEKNKKITYVDCTRWLFPNIGGKRQIWMKTSQGIPGSKDQVRLHAPGLFLRHPLRNINF